MNVLLVATDTLSARHMGCFGYGRETSPFMDRYARDNVLFESLYCQAIPTQPAYTSIFTGQYAVTHGIVSHGGDRVLARDAPWLPTILRNAGYTTCAVDNLYDHKPWFSRGYEFYINPKKPGEYAQFTPCDVYNARAIPWLKRHADERFFMFVHYWDPHTPYIPPEKYRSLFFDGDPCDPSNRTLEGLWRHPFGEPWKKWFDLLQPGITDAEYIVAMYDSEIRYADDGLRALLAALDETGLAEETLVILTSDHGEMMYRHGIYFDHHGLYDSDIHVPLIIRWPQAAKTGRRIPHLVQHIDLAPTVLDALGVDVPESMEGTSLVPYLTGGRDEPIYPYLVTEECTRQMKWGLRKDGYKFILARQEDYQRNPMRELYDLSADPDEFNNIAEERPDLAREMEETLEGWIARLMEKNGLTEDPLVANGVPIGMSWLDWVKKHGYW